MNPENLQNQFLDARTDESELEEIIEEFDLDQFLIDEFNEISKLFSQLKIDYQIIVRTRELGV